MILALFGVGVTAVWANTDTKTGYVNPWVMAIPGVLLALINFWAFLFVFAPFFGLFTLIYVVVNKKTPYKFGFADVMALPFAMAVIFSYGIFYQMAFALTLGFQMAFIGRLPRLFVGKRDEKGNIRFCPLLFNALVVGGLVAWLI